MIRETNITIPPHPSLIHSKVDLDCYTDSEFASSLNLVNPSLQWLPQIDEMIRALVDSPDFKKFMPELARSFRFTQASAYIKTLKRSQKFRSRKTFLIIQNSELCGVITYSLILKTNEKKALIAYFKNPLCSRKGVITLALQRLSSYVTHQSITPVLSISCDNYSSTNVAIRAGFKSDNVIVNGHVEYTKPLDKAVNDCV